MSKHRPLLPEFDNPPVIEVALSAQFNPLGLLSSAHLGLLWNEFRDRFPRTEDHFPQDSAFEKFEIPGPPKIQLQFEEKPPVPKCWLLNKKGTELIQIQQDRFVHNWRKVEEEGDYPRYEYIRDKFKEELNTFSEFIAREQLGKMVPNQCEVTYVNHIISGEGWDRHGQLGEVLTTWTGRYSDSFLSEPENVRFIEKHIILNNNGKPVGRLHISIEPAYRRVDKKPILVMKLTARGAPEGQTIEDVLQFLDKGRTWVVRGFTSITSDRMHQLWRRSDGN